MSVKFLTSSPIIMEASPEIMFNVKTVGFAYKSSTSRYQVAITF